MYFVIFLLIFTSANNFYFLFPWSKISGSFNTIDIGLFLLAVTLAWLLIRKQHIRAFNNVFSLYLVFLLFMVVFHIFYANIRFNLRYFDSIIHSRYYLYYFSFFFFLYVLDSPEKFRRALNVMSYISIIIVGLSIVNYFGPVIFYHEWAEGHYQRVGIKRAFIPNMALISFCSVWSFCDLFSRGRLNLSAGWKSGVLFAAHIFRQTRMRLMSILLILGLLVATKGNLKNRIVAVLFVVISTIAIFTTFKSNLLFELFESSYYDITQKQGTWGGRIWYIDWNLKELMKSPIVGTGSSAVRASEKAYEHLPTDRKKYFMLLGKQTDLGYIIFIRNFGLVGLIWIICFFFTALKRSWNLMGICKNKNADLASFCFFYFVFVFVSSVTLNNFTLPDRIFFNSFVMALIIRLQQGSLQTMELKP